MREIAIHDSLVSLIPKDFEVTSGFVIDANGGITPQIDLLVHQRDALSPLLLTGKAALLPVETFRFGIEVKSTVTRKDFDQVKVQANSLGDLWYSAWIPAIHPSTKNVTLKFKKEPPPFLLVAFTSQLSTQNLKDELHQTTGLAGVVVIDQCIIYKGQEVFEGASNLERVIRFWAYMFQHCLDLREYVTITNEKEQEIVEEIGRLQPGIDISNAANRLTILTAVKTPSILPYLYPGSP